MGLAAHLTAAEILEQLWHAWVLVNKGDNGSNLSKIRNVVFMGM